MKYRTKRRLVRSILLLSIFIFIFTRYRRYASYLHTSDFLESIDTVLANAVTTSLTQQPHSTGVQDIGLHITQKMTRTSNIRMVQDSVACFLEQGAWTYNRTLNLTPLRKGFKLSKFLHFTPDYTCLPNYMALSENTRISVLCAILKAKKVLLVGPEATFHLHSIWLKALAGQENRTFDCLGPEFCTFHHICQPPATKATTELYHIGRNKKLPREQDLLSSGSAILRYVLSTSLHADPDPLDKSYTVPQIDPLTKVRMRNAYWLNQARRADILVINRGPIPAPAETYDIPTGNWTFVDRLETNESAIFPRNLLPSVSSPERRIINAALHATLNLFLPSLLRILQTLRTDVMIRNKAIIWHGSWYADPQCSDPDFSIPNGVRTHEDLLRLQVDARAPVQELWSLYYNAQVYMHMRLLRQLLPHYGVIFIPQTIPFAPSNDMDVIRKDRLPTRSELPLDCIRPRIVSPAGDAAQVAFLGGLVQALSLS